MTNIIRLFAYCKGGTSWMRNQDWSALDIGKSLKWGVVLFKSNFIILRHYLRIDAKDIIYSLKRQQNNCIWNYLFNISMEANIVDPDQTALSGVVWSGSTDQTAPTGVVWSGYTLFVYEASNILVGDKNIHFVIMRFKG